MKLLIKQLIKIMFVIDFIINIRIKIRESISKHIRRWLISISKNIRNIRNYISMKNTHEEGRICVDLNFLTKLYQLLFLELYTALFLNSAILIFRVF